jgi:hypothetical protein
MEFLNSIFVRGFWAYTLVFSESISCLVFYPHFSFYKMLFMNRLKFSCFADYFCVFLKPEVVMVFLKKPPVEGDVNCMEQKTRVFFQIDDQEFHLWPAGVHQRCDAYAKLFISVADAAPGSWIRCLFERWGRISYSGSRIRPIFLRA